MSKNKDIEKRLFLPPLAELLDRMTVTQIKQAILGDKNKDFSNEMQKISHDIDLIISEKKNLFRCSDNSNNYINFTNEFTHME